MKPDINEDRNIALGLARSFSPYETGNMRYNAIKSQLVHNGFDIIYDLQSAFYIYFQEEGTRFSMANKGFIETKTVPAIQGYLTAKYNGYKQKLNDYKMMAKEGDRDIPTIKGQEKLLLERGQRLQSSLNVNVDVLDIQYNWKYRNE